MSSIGSTGTPSPIQSVVPKAAPVKPSPSTAPVSDAPDTKPTSSPVSTPPTPSSHVVESGDVQKGVSSSSSGEISVKSQQLGVLSLLSGLKASYVTKTDSLKAQLTEFKSMVQKAPSTKPLGILRATHRPESSIKDKMLSLAFRAQSKKELSPENVEFMDKLIELSDKGPGSPTLDADLTAIYTTFVERESAKMINLAYAERNAAQAAYEDYQVALAAYADDPSPENLNELNTARTELTYCIQDCSSSIIENLNDTHVRLQATDLFAEISALEEGSIDVESLSEGARQIYDQLEIAPEPKELGRVEKAMQKLSQSVKSVKSYFSGLFKTSDKPSPFELPTSTLIMGVHNPDASSIEAKASAAFRTFLTMEMGYENIEFADRVKQLGDMEPGSEAADSHMHKLVSDLILRESGEFDQLNLSGVNKHDHPIKVAYRAFTEAEAAYEDNPCPETQAPLHEARAALVESLETGVKESIRFLDLDKGADFRALGSERRADSLKDLDFIMAHDTQIGKKSMATALHISKIVEGKYPRDQQIRVQKFEQALELYHGFLGE